MIYMLWKECMPQRFYKHICKDKNFLYLKGKNVLQLYVSEIITFFLKEKKENYLELRNKVQRYFSTKIFSSTYILMYFQRFTARPKGEVSTSRALFILYSKPTRTKRTLNPQVKIFKTMKMFIMRHLFMNKNHKKQMILMKLRKKR